VLTHSGMHWCKPINKPGSAFAPSRQKAQLTYTAPNLLQLPGV